MFWRYSSLYTLTCSRPSLMLSVVCDCTWSVFWCSVWLYYIYIHYNAGVQVCTEVDPFTGRRVTKEKPKEKSAYMLFYERVQPLSVKTHTTTTTTSSSSSTSTSTSTTSPILEPHGSQQSPTRQQKTSLSASLPHKETSKSRVNCIPVDIYHVCDRLSLFCVVCS
jgi:hypothetical protein